MTTQQRPVLRLDKVERILSIATAGSSCAIYGLSNTGKTALMRALSRPEALARYEALAGQPGVLIYIDCNRVVELNATGFYEVVVRSLLEYLEDPATPPNPPPVLLTQLREAHNRIVNGSPFQASLAFNNAVSESCARLGLNLVLLLDEFDEIYAALEDRTLLNLRALKDHSRRRLVYVTATLRPLTESRAPGDNEFAELFTAYSLPLGLLSDDDAWRLLEEQGAGSLPDDAAQAVLRLGGGHSGLLAALASAALRTAPGEDTQARLSTNPAARAECLKLWQQLGPDEQAALAALAAAHPAPGSTAGADPLTGAGLERLRSLGLVTSAPNGGGLFSDLFAAFVRRHSALPADGDGVVVDNDSGEVWVDGARVSILTDLEYRLIRLLDERRDRLTTKEMIVEAVWGGEYQDRMDDARIEKLVSRLRAKMEPDPARPRYLLTQRGRGYKLSSLPAESLA